MLENNITVNSNDRQQKTIIQTFNIDLLNIK